MSEIILVDQTTVSTPAPGKRALYSKGGRLTVRDSSGSDAEIGSMLRPVLVGELIPGVPGETAFATNGKKSFEVTAGVPGTGVPVYFSNGQWRVYGTDAVVTEQAVD